MRAAGAPDPIGSSTPVGRLRLHYQTLGSTNDLARVLVRAGYPSGTVVIAEHQSAGRGRQGRRWEAALGAALLCSTLLRPRLAASALPALSMAAALATAEAIERRCAIEVALKWPNDVLIGRPLRKAAGILVETVLSNVDPAGTGSDEAGSVSAGIQGVVVGIGINIASSPPDVPTATHLVAAAGRPVDRRALLDLLLARLAGWLAQTPADAVLAPPSLVAAWRERLITLGQPVQVAAIDETDAALALDVDADGALLVRRDDGALARVLAADVSLSHPLVDDRHG
jgi:BirA family biotin operon repressor/biotin-[acetyl-CoA-carboxylase] ligase